MRYGMSFMVLAMLAGCSASAPSSAKAPEGKPTAPSTPAAPAKPSAPAAPAKPEAAMAPKPADPVKPAAAAVVVDKTPLKADISKVKFTTQSGAELFGYDDGESRAFYYSNGLGEVVVKVPADGEYEIVITAACNAAKGENAKFKLVVDGAPVGAETQLKSEDAKDYAFTSALKAGDRKIGAEFTNDVYKEGEYDMNFYLHGVKVVRLK